MTTTPSFQFICYFIVHIKELFDNKNIKLINQITTKPSKYTYRSSHHRLMVTTYSG